VNAGSATWRVGAGVGTVRLGGRLLDDTGTSISELDRAELQADVPPGGSCMLTVDVPSAAGARHAKFDMVADRVAWFEDRGSEPLVLNLT